MNVGSKTEPKAGTQTANNFNTNNADGTLTASEFPALTGDVSTIAGPLATSIRRCRRIEPGRTHGEG